MRRELALLGLAILTLSLAGCTSSEGSLTQDDATVTELEIDLSEDGFDSVSHEVVPSEEPVAEPLPATAASLGITEDDLAISDLDIELSDDGFSTDLGI